jgi:hypothetical protein
MSEPTTAASQVNNPLLDLYLSLDPAGKAIFIEVFGEKEDETP